MNMRPSAIRCYERECTDNTTQSPFLQIDLPREGMVVSLLGCGHICRGTNVQTNRCCQCTGVSPACVICRVGLVVSR